AHADLVHRRERRGDDHVERHAEEGGADRQKDDDGDRARRDALLPARKERGAVYGDSPVDLGAATTFGDRGRALRAPRGRSRQAVSSTSGRKIAAVISSMMTAAAEA